MTDSATLLALAASFSLAACDNDGGDPIATQPLAGWHGYTVPGEDIRVWRDEQTGCKYLIWRGYRKGGITPRLTADGKPSCSTARAVTQPVSGAEGE